MEIDWCQHHTEWTEGCKYCGPAEVKGEFHLPLVDDLLKNGSAPQRSKRR